MKRLDLQKCIVGSVFTNCYFLKNKETEEMLIVDPGVMPTESNRRFLKCRADRLQFF